MTPADLSATSLELLIMGNLPDVAPDAILAERAVLVGWRPPSGNRGAVTTDSFGRTGLTTPLYPIDFPSMASHRTRRSTRPGGPFHVHDGQEETPA